MNILLFSLFFSLTVKSIEFKGIKWTNRDFLLQQIWHRQGEKFIPEKLQEDKDRLLRLKVISDVQINYKIEGDSVELVYTLKEIWPIWPTLGLSINDEYGWIFFFGCEHLNFRGRAEVLEVSGILGGLKGFKIAYTQPVIPGRRNSFSFAIENSQYKHIVEDFLMNTRILYTRWSFKPINEKNLWFSISVNPQQVTVYDPGKTIESDNSDEFVEMETGIKYETLDYPLHPSSGMILNSAFTKFYGGRNSVDFSRLEIEGGYFLHPPLGHTFGIGVDFIIQRGRIPVYKTLYSGGQWLRGYQYGAESGNIKLAISFEWRVNLGPKYKFEWLFLQPVGVIFTDICYVQKTLVSPGIGFCLHVPVIGAGGIYFGYNQEEKRIYPYFLSGWKF